MRKNMELDLTPKTAQEAFEGEGGAYYARSISYMPLLAKANVAAGWLLLQPDGFALPHYADSHKVGYVLQGTDGVVGLVFPNTEKEAVVKLKKGDVIPIPIGTISWWFNHREDSQISIAFLGETSQASIAGQFTYFFLTGTLGLLGGFSTELTAKVYNLSTEEATKLTKNQNGVLIIKLQKDQPLPKPQTDLTKELVYNIDVAHPDSVNHGGSITTVKETEFPFVGLSLVRVKLEPNAIRAPIVHGANSAIQLVYIAKGDGRIEIVDTNGKSALNIQVKAGQLLLVPQFFVVAEIAVAQGMEIFYFNN